MISIDPAGPGRFPYFLDSVSPRILSFLVFLLLFDFYEENIKKAFLNILIIFIELLVCNLVFCVLVQLQPELQKIATSCIFNEEKLNQILLLKLHKMQFMTE